MEEIYSAKRSFSERLKSYSFHDWFLIFIGIVFLTIIVTLIFGIHPKSVQGKVLSGNCGDGAFNNTCSLERPYYCSSGKLIYQPDLCGCPVGSKNENGTCSVNGSVSYKEITLNYVLRGKKGTLEFPLYGNISSYLSNQSQEITYTTKELPRLDDFVMKKIDNSYQTQALIPLIVAIQNSAPNSIEDQARIAISAVQNIPYVDSNITSNFYGTSFQVSRYPYNVLLQNGGACQGKSELLVFVLKELGYRTALFYYPKEDHEAVGVKCPLADSLDGSGYCFVESTVPAPISYSTGSYLGIPGGVLSSKPSVIVLSRGASFSSGMYEYKDAKKLSKIIGANGKTGRINPIQKRILSKLKEKYGLTYGF